MRIIFRSILATYATSVEDDALSPGLQQLSAHDAFHTTFASPAFFVQMLRSLELCLILLRRLLDAIDETPRARGDRPRHITISYSC